MRSRVLILTAALAIGLIAAFAAGHYLDSARKQVEAGTRPVKVLVAVKDVPPGMSAEAALKDGSIIKREVARQYVADQAVSSFSTIDGRVSAVPLTPGEQVTQGDFRFSSEAGASFSVPEGLLAVSLRDDPVRGVSRMIRPGDFVAVVATFEPKQGDITAAITKIVIRRARVLAIDQDLTSVTATGGASTISNSSGNSALLGSSSSSSNSTQMDTVTLAITPTEVETLVFSDEEGEVRLALIAKADDKPAPTRGVRYDDVIR